MKSLSISLLLLLLLVHLAPVEVVAEESTAQVIVTFDELLIFQSPSGGLWRTDGTPAGTFWLGPTCGPDSNCKPIIGHAGGKLFFLAEISELPRRYQLWATDGTRQGTQQLTDFPEGLNSNIYPYGEYLAGPTLGSLFFRGISPATGAEPWVSDGTPAGTHLLVDLAPGPTDGLGRFLAEVNGQALFEGITPQRGGELWRSDGSLTGTKLLWEFVPGPDSAQLRFLTVLADQMYFSFTTGELGHELWVTNGSVAGTKLLYAPKVPSGLPPEVWWLDGVAGQTQVFLLSQFFDGDGMHPMRLVRSDGTPAGTYPVHDGAFINAFGDSVLFIHGDDEHGWEPWFSDGTPEGTRILKDLEPGPTSGHPFSDFVQGESLAYFLAGSNYVAGGWLTDGTTTGTQRFFVFSGATFDPPWLAWGPRDRLFFTNRVMDMQELWVTPPAGHNVDQPVRLIGPSLRPSLTRDNFGIVGAPLGKLFFFVTRDREHGTALWRSDATVGGTFPLVELGPPDLPGPIQLSAALEGNGILLNWQRADRAQYYEFERSSPETGFIPGVRVAADRTTYFEGGLVPETPYAFRVRGVNAFGAGPWSNVAAATPLSVVITPCVPAGWSLCLHGSRFEVKAFYRDHLHDGWGGAWAVPLDFSDDSGAFWFFDETNLELMVKVLDARVVNGYFWSFFGGLTTLETWITVTDTEAQTNATFYKSPDDLCGQADVTAFPGPVFGALVTTGTCEPGPNHLCLAGNRYRVEVDWRDQRSGHTGVGHAIPGTEDSGFFWFFDNENVELLVKVLDARTVNGHTWVFSSSMTDVEYTLTVTDTLTGRRKQYFHPPGSLCGQADVAAF